MAGIIPIVQSNTTNAYSGHFQAESNSQKGNLINNNSTMVQGVLAVIGSL
jgi:hypothetical protein